MGKLDNVYRWHKHLGVPGDIELPFFVYITSRSFYAKAAFTVWESPLIFPFCFREQVFCEYSAPANIFFIHKKKLIEEKSMGIY